jgi:hypothetical protein
MKTLVQLLHFSDRHIRWEKAVESPLNGLDIQFALRFEVGHLSQGMNPCVRPSRSNQMNRFSGEAGQFLFDEALDRHPFGLNLPSQVLGPIVFNGKLNGSHLN